MTSEINKLKLAGYGNGEGGPNDWMYQQVIEAVAIFVSHDNSGMSATWELEKEAYEEMRNNK